MWKYISDNYKWLFSGIGVVVVVAVLNVINYKVEPVEQSQPVGSADSSTVLDSEPPDQPAQDRDTERGHARDWFANNYKWLFSGIGVVIVAGLARFFRGKVKAKPGGQSELHDKTDAPAAGEPERIQSTKPVQSQKELAGQLTPDGILQEIKSAPLLHQVAMAESFRGITVNWTGKLLGLSSDTSNPDKVSVHIGIGDPRHSVFCYLEKGKYPGLATLRKEHPIQVYGKIDEVSLFGWIRLMDASVSF